MTLPAAEVQRYVHAEFTDGLCGAFDDAACVCHVHAGTASPVVG
jgi:hypothetical protein